MGVSVSISVSHLKSLSAENRKVCRNFDIIEMPERDFSSRVNMKHFEAFPCYFMTCLSIPGYLFGNLRGFRGEVNCCLITLNPLTFPGSKQLALREGSDFFNAQRDLWPRF